MIATRHVMRILSIACIHLAKGRTCVVVQCGSEKVHVKGPNYEDFEELRHYVLYRDWLRQLRDLDIKHTKHMCDDDSFGLNERCDLKDDLMGSLFVA